MARPSNPNSERSIAARLSTELNESITRKAVQVLKTAGVDLNDLEAVRKYRRNSQRAGLNGSGSGNGSGARSKTETPSEIPEEEITAENIDGQIEKLRKDLLATTEKRDAETISIKILGLGRIQGMLREQGKYILASDAEAEGMRFGMAAKHMWEEIEDSLPPMMEGLTALQMKTKLREFASARALDLHEFFTE